MQDNACTDHQQATPYARLHIVVQCQGLLGQHVLSQQHAECGLQGVQGFCEAGTSESNVCPALKGYIASPTPSTLGKYLCNVPASQTPSTAVQLSPGLVLHSTLGMSRYGC